MRGICSLCGSECFITKNNLSSCCHYNILEELKDGIIKKESDYKFKNRKLPSKSRQYELLQNQNNKCFYCDREFGNYAISKNGLLVILKPNWDHCIPYSFTHSCADNQFVASCFRCNINKNSAVPYSDKSLEDLKLYLSDKWYRNGWKDAS